MAERVGALAYDLVMNTVRFEKGMERTRSSLRTLNDNFKKAAHPVDEYEQRMRDLNVALKDEQISKDRFDLFSEQELERLKKAGYVLDENGKAEKTNAKILEEKIEAQKELNREKRLEKKLQDEMNFQSERDFVKRRFRSAEEHRKVLDRAHEIRRANKSIFQQRTMDAKKHFGDLLGMLGGMSPGQQAGVLGNLVGALGGSGAMIGAVRGAAMLGAKMVPIVASVAALGIALKKAAENAAILRKTTIDLSVLMNNSDEAASGLIKRFQALARETPLTTTQLAEGARQLMSFGRESKFVVEDLKAIGIIAGGDVERMRLLVKAFGDVTAAGKLQGQELRQFTNQGWNPLRKMVDLTGESYDKLRKKMEDGQISAEMVSRAMIASAEEYGDRLEKSMDTVFAQWAKFKGILFELSTKPGAPVERVAAGLLKGLNYSIEGWEMAFDGMSNYAEDRTNQAYAALQRLKDFMSFDFANAFSGADRFGDPMTAREREAHQEKLRKEIIEAQEKAAKINGKTTANNQKLIDDLGDEILKQKDIVKSLDDQFNRISKYERMIRDLRVERHFKRITQQDFDKAVEQIKELERLDEESKKKRAMVEDPIKDLDKMHAHRMKQIEKEGNEKTKGVEELFKKEMDHANLLRSMGGPTDDFTSAGADYRFVAQRNAEIQAKQAEKAANAKRESQLEAIRNELELARRQAELDTEATRRSLPQAVN